MCVLKLSRDSRRKANEIMSNGQRIRPTSSRSIPYFTRSRMGCPINRCVCVYHLYRCKTSLYCRGAPSVASYAMSAPPPPPPKGKGKSGMSGATDALRALAGLQTTQEQQTAVEAAQKARTLKRRAEDVLPDFGVEEQHQ